MKNQLLPPQGKDNIHLKDFLNNYECKAHLTQPLTLPQHKINVAYCTLHLRLAIETDRPHIIPIPRDRILRHFHSYDVHQKRGALLWLGYALYNYVKDRFPYPI